MTSLGNYRPGRSLLHRAPAGYKLLTLSLISLASVVWRSTTTTAGLLIIAAAGFLLSGTGLGPPLRTFRKLIVMITLVGGYQVWRHGPEQAFVIVGNLVGLMLLATLLATVTPIDHMLDTLTKMVRPLRRFGMNPERIALAFSLMMRAIPATMSTGLETRHAALARGLDRSPRAHLAPLVIRTIAHARATGAALFARNILDDYEATEEDDEVLDGDDREFGKL